MQITAQDLIAMLPQLAEDTPRNLLHVGCGHKTISSLPAFFQNGNWQEIRLDIDKAVRPDVVASMTSMPLVRDGSIDAIFSSHNLEHLEDYQTDRALDEFRRVLKRPGVLVATVPDLEQVLRLILDRVGDTPLYQSPAGPISPFDMLFGHQKSLKAGRTHMAHRTGFTANRLGKKLVDAGFSEVRVRHGSAFDLWAIATLS